MLDAIVAGLVGLLVAGSASLLVTGGALRKAVIDDLDLLEKLPKVDPSLGSIQEVVSVRAWELAARLRHPFVLLSDVYALAGMLLLLAAPPALAALAFESTGAWESPSVAGITLLILIAFNLVAYERARAWIIRACRRALFIANGGPQHLQSAAESVATTIVVYRLTVFMLALLGLVGHAITCVLLVGGDAWVLVSLLFWTAWAIAMIFVLPRRRTHDLPQLRASVDADDTRRDEPPTSRPSKAFEAVRRAADPHRRRAPTIAPSDPMPRTENE